MVILPGTYLFEIETVRPVTAEAIAQGFSTILEDVVFDESAMSPARSGSNGAPSGLLQTAELLPPALRQGDVPESPEWGSPFLERDNAAAAAHGTRFIAKVPQPIEIRDPPDLRWLFIGPVTLDPYGPLRTRGVVPFALETGFTYEMRLLSRMKNAGSRVTVAAGLRAMRFRTLKLCALKRAMRLPDRPGADYVLWYAVGRWEGPKSYVSAEDPFLFEEVVAVAG